jgi:hypothetical protein
MKENFKVITSPSLYEYSRYLDADVIYGGFFFRIKGPENHPWPSKGRAPTPLKRWKVSCPHQ